MKTTNKTTKTTTVLDVAKLAGVSYSLVSMVLTHNPAARLTDETRARIMDAARKLNYRPNQLARSLRQGRTRTIGIVQGGIGDSLTGLRMENYMMEAEKLGYTVLLGLSYFNQKKEQEVLLQMLDRSVDGIIFGFSPTLNRDFINSNSDISVPIVFLEYDPLLNYSSVSYDILPGIREMVDVFSKDGIHNFLFINGLFVGDEDVLKKVNLPNGMQASSLKWNPMFRNPEEKLQEIAKNEYDIIITIPSIGKYIQNRLPDIRTRFVYYIDSPGLQFQANNIYGFLERPFNVQNKAVLKRLIRLIEKKELKDVPLGEFLPVHFTRTSNPEDIPWYREMQVEIQERYSYFNPSMYL